jgi:hypothetical protein
MNDNQWIFMGDNLSVEFTSAWAIVTPMLDSSDVLGDSLALFCAYDGVTV